MAPPRRAHGFKPIRFAPLALLLAATIARAADDTGPDAGLNALYEAGTKLTALKADVSLTTLSGDSDGTGDDGETKAGAFVLQRLPGGGSRVRVTFKTTQTGTRPKEIRREEYLVAGNAFSQEDGRMQKRTERSLGQAGGKLDLFSLNGPFPLPIGQKPDDVKNDFTVTAVPSDDPAALAKLKLVPKPGTGLADKFKDILIVVDRATRLPKQIQTDGTSGDTKTTTLTNVLVNPAVGDADFDLGPLPEGWRLVTAK